MDSPFIYSKYVTGRANIGRKDTQTVLANLLDQCENVVMYEPEKSGKESLIQQTFFNMRISGRAFISTEISLMGICSREELLARLGSAVIRIGGSTPDEYASLAHKYLEGSCFVFDPEAFAGTDAILSVRGKAEENDIRAVLGLPYRLAQELGQKVYVILADFQEITRQDGWEFLLKTFENVLREAPRGLCSYIFTGGSVNAMKELFEHAVWFHRLINHLQLNPVEPRDITDFIVKGFLTGGKVVDRDLCMGICNLFRCNLWYINHFSAICDHLSKGYITEATLMEALGMLIAIHEPRFKAIMADLTNYQLSLLKAVLEGCNRFSSAEVIKRYGLNSSANVRRLKDALCKKEIITFNEKDEAMVLDPLFEYWAGKYYFDIARDK